jgi:DNA-binding IclR family transcriptional regulator
MVQLAKSLNLPKATVHRMCKTLTKYDFLSFDDNTKRYSLGIKLFELGSIVLSSFSLRRIASPHLERLLEPGKTVHIGILQDDHTLYIDQRVSESDDLKYIPLIGKQRPPYYGAHGQILMAYLPDEKVDELIRKSPLKALTKKSITDYGQFKRRLTLIRSQGYFVDEGETNVGFTTISAPIRNIEGKVVAAVNIGFNSALEDKKGLQRITQKTIKTAKAISAGLGYIDQRENI